MEKNKPTYSEAISEIESILDKLNNEDFDVDTLAAEVKRATELIALCKERLRKAEDDVAKVLKPDDKA